MVEMFRESNVWWQNNNIKDRTLITAILFHICALYYAGCDAKVLVFVEQLRLSADHIMNTNKIHHGILTPRLNTVLTLLLYFNNRPTTYSLGCAFCCCIDAIIDICSMKLTWLFLNWTTLLTLSTGSVAILWQVFWWCVIWSISHWKCTHFVTHLRWWLNLICIFYWQ